MKAKCVDPKSYSARFNDINVRIEMLTAELTKGIREGVRMPSTQEKLNNLLAEKRSLLEELGKNS